MTRSRVDASKQHPTQDAYSDAARRKSALPNAAASIRRDQEAWKLARSSRQAPGVEVPHEGRQLFVARAGRGFRPAESFSELNEPRTFAPAEAACSERHQVSLMAPVSPTPSAGCRAAWVRLVAQKRTVHGRGLSDRQPPVAEVWISVLVSPALLLPCLLISLPYIFPTITDVLRLPKR